MQGPSKLRVRDILAAYSQKRATTEAVIRSLISHRGWLAPVMWMAAWQSGFDAIFHYGDMTRLPPGEIWIFTDHEAASTAASVGGDLGDYATGIAGDEIFRRLDGKWGVRVNPGSPAEHTWFISRGSSAQLSMWCDAVELEDAIAKIPAPDPEALLKMVFAYKWFLIPLRKSDGGLVTFTDESRTELAPLFTTLDNLGRFMDKLSAADREQVRSATVNGAQFFDFIRGHDHIRSVVINACGPAASWIFHLRSEKSERGPRAFPGA